MVKEKRNNKRICHNKESAELSETKLENETEVNSKKRSIIWNHFKKYKNDNDNDVKWAKYCYCM